jgi:hypothetical protein
MASRSRVKVILFDDVEDIRDEISGSLKRRLGKEGTVRVFDLESRGAEAEEALTYEDRLTRSLSRAPYAGATLLVADAALSQSSGYRGLSVGAVISAGRKLAVPICDYARDPSPDRWRVRWEEGRINLSLAEGVDEFARRVILIARGFATIATQLPVITRTKANRNPAALLAALLGKPEYVDKIALYSVGDQNRIADMSPPDQEKKEQGRRLVNFLGHWIWDSLLRYPGVLVNEVAAASYLNIATGDFRKPKVRAIFKKALYDGPFADKQRPQWWRGMLDDLVAQSGHKDGLQLARDKTSNPRIARSECCEDSSKAAGYYCIISEAPVSLENSKGGLSWFPRGADLTRISKTRFDEYSPWLGN